MGLCTSYEHVPQRISSNEMIALFFWQINAFRLHYFVKHKDIPQTSRKMHFANMCFDIHRLKRIPSGRCSRVGCSPAARAGALGAAAPPGDAGMEPGSATASRLGPAAVLQWLQADLRRYCRARGRKGDSGSLIRTKLHFTASLSSCTALSSSGDLGVIGYSLIWSLCFKCTPASESLHSSYI